MRIGRRAQSDPGIQDSQDIMITTPLWILLFLSATQAWAAGGNLGYAINDLLTTQRPRALALVVDIADAEALRVLQEASEFIKYNPSTPGDWYALAPFDNTSLPDVRIINSWAEVREAVKRLERKRHDSSHDDDDDGVVGALDAILAVKSSAPRGARIILVTATGVSALDRQDADDFLRATTALHSSGLRVDIWLTANCNDPNMRALRNISIATNGRFSCDGEPRSDGGRLEKEIRRGVIGDLTLPVRVNSGIQQEPRLPVGGADPERTILTAPSDGASNRNFVELEGPRDVGFVPSRTLDNDVRGLSRLNRSPQGEEAIDLAGEEIPYIQTSQWDPKENPDTSVLVESTGNVKPGDTFTRSSNLTDNKNHILILPPPVILEITPRQQLNVLPGQNVQLNFEITNNRNIPMRFLLHLRSERSHLQLWPMVINLGPQQKLPIQAAVAVHPNAFEGESEKFTLSAKSDFEVTTKSVLLYIGRQNINDPWLPTVWASWKSTCKGAWDPSNCNTNAWTIDFDIQDRDSGLLTIQTIPPFVGFRGEFISGTREPVKAFYSASCCAKKVDLIVTDVQGNTLRQTYDVGSQFLNEGEIAAIVLGVLGIILIIVLIILAIILCRRRESRRLERSLGSRH